MPKTPILIIGFNRADSIRQVFEAVRKIKPEKLYISLDGARIGNKKDSKNCAAVKDVLANVDWPCDVHRNYHEKNLGSAPHIVTAIDWFFSEVESGIILEDDCVPDPSFMTFAGTLLDRYATNEKIMAISGSYLAPGDKTYSYYFSHYFLGWGWATWRRSWKLFERSIAPDPEAFMDSLYKKGTLSQPEANFYKKFFRNYLKNKYDHWDGKWLYSMWKNDAVCIIPTSNLVQNIGFTKDATHTFVRDERIPDYTESINNIIHPPKVEVDMKRDFYLFKAFYYRTFLQKVIYKLQVYANKLTR